MATRFRVPKGATPVGPSSLAPPTPAPFKPSRVPLGAKRVEGPSVEQPEEPADFQPADLSDNGPRKPSTAAPQIGAPSSPLRASQTQTPAAPPVVAGASSSPQPLGALATARAIATQVKDAVETHLPAGIQSIREGGDFDPLNTDDAAIEKSRRLTMQQMQKPDVPTAIPGVSSHDIASLGPSLGVSAPATAAGIGAGVGAGAVGSLATPAVGVAAGYGAGGLASGAAAYRGSINQFKRDLYDAANEESVHKTGAPVDVNEFRARMQEIEPLITEYGLWEAGPEAASNMIGFGVLKAPVKAAVAKMFGESVLGKFGAKAATIAGKAVGVAAPEVATEVATGMGQHNVSIDAGLTEGPKRSWTSAADLGQTFNEVAPATLMQTALMAGGVKAGMMIQDRIKRGSLTPEVYDELMALNARIDASRTSPAMVDLEVAKILDPEGYGVSMAPEEFEARKAAAGLAREAAGGPSTGPVPPGAGGAPPPSGATPQARGVAPTEAVPTPVVEETPLTPEEEARAAAAAPRGPAPQRARNIMDAIKAAGGLKPSGETRARNLQMNPGLVNVNGRTEDEMREYLQQEGWFGYDADGGGAMTDTRPMWKILDDHIAGAPQYHPADQHLIGDRSEFERRRLADDEAAQRLEAGESLENVISTPRGNQSYDQQSQGDSQKNGPGGNQPLDPFDLASLEAEYANRRAAVTDPVERDKLHEEDDDEIERLIREVQAGEWSGSDDLAEDPGLPGSFERAPADDQRQAAPPVEPQASRLPRGAVRVSPDAAPFAASDGKAVPSSGDRPSPGESREDADPVDPEETLRQRALKIYRAPDNARSLNDIIADLRNEEEAAAAGSFAGGKPEAGGAPVTAAAGSTTQPAQKVPSTEKINTVDGKRDQMVLPGAERDASQKSAAKTAEKRKVDELRLGARKSIPTVPQEKADVGLFAAASEREPSPQSSLALDAPAQSAPAAESPRDVPAQGSVEGQSAGEAVTRDQVEEDDDGPRQVVAKLRETASKRDLNANATEENVRQARAGKKITSLDTKEAEQHIAEAEEAVKKDREASARDRKQADEIERFHQSEDGKRWRRELRKMASEVEEHSPDTAADLRKAADRAPLGMQSIETWKRIADGAVRAAKSRKGTLEPIPYERDWKIDDLVDSADSVDLLRNEGLLGRVEAALDRAGEALAATGLRAHEVNSFFGNKAAFAARARFSEILATATKYASEAKRVKAGHKNASPEKLEALKADLEQALGNDKGTAQNPVQANSAADLKTARDQIDREATDDQIRAGNYAKGHIEWRGIRITIETGKGHKRTNKGAGPKWSVTMPADYGYIKGTKGADDEQVDVFVGGHLTSNRVFVVDQYTLDGTFDEYKVFIGFRNQDEAIAAYDGSFSDGSGPRRRRFVTPITVLQLKRGLNNWARKKPVYRVAEAPKGWDKVGIDAEDIVFDGRKVLEMQQQLRTLLNELGLSDVKTFLFDDFAKGRFSLRDRQAFIGLAMRLSNAKPEVRKHTIGHEALHAMRHMGLITQKEWNVLVRAARAGNWIKRYRIKERYPNGDEDLLIEEAIAERFGDHYSGEMPAPKGIAKIADKIREILEKIGNLFRRNGYRSAKSVMEALARGDAATRERRMGEVAKTLEQVVKFSPVPKAWLDAALKYFNEGGNPFSLSFEDMFPVDPKTFKTRLTDKQIEMLLDGDATAREMFERRIAKAEDRRQRGMETQAERRIDNAHKWLAAQWIQNNVLFPLHTAEIDALRTQYVNSGMKYWDAHDKAKKDVEERHQHRIPYKGPTLKDVARAFGDALADKDTVDIRRLKGEIAEHEQQLRDPAYLQKLVDINNANDPDRPFTIFDAKALVRQGMKARQEMLAKLEGITRDQVPMPPPFTGGPPQQTPPPNNNARRRRQPTLLQMDLSIPDETVLDVLRDIQMPFWDRVGSLTKDNWAEQFRRVTTRLFDKINYQREVEDKIEGITGHRLGAHERAYQGDTLRSGRTGARLQELNIDKIEPLIEEIVASGLPMETIERYLHARHTRAREARVQAINPYFQQNGGGAGWQYQQWGTPEQYIADRQADGTIVDLERIERRVRDLLDFHVQTRLQSGLWSADDVARMKKAFGDTYVPLRGTKEEAGDPDDIAEIRGKTGRGTSVGGRESEMATGRDSAPTHILANTIMMAQESVIRAEKNRVGQMLYNLVHNHPDDNTWRIDPQEYVPRPNKDTGLIEWVPKRTLSAEEAKHTLRVKIDGREHRIYIKDTRIAAGWLNLDVGVGNEIVEGFRSIMTFMARMATGWNPAFIVLNAPRDFETAMFVLNAKFGHMPNMDGLKRDVVKNYPKAMAASWGGQVGKNNTAWQQYFREWQEDGGRVSFFKPDDLRAQVVNLRKEIKARTSKGLMPMPKKAVRALFGTIERANSAVDDAIRLSTYVALRNRGMSRADAAEASKNLTVNFNKHGSWGPLLNLFYLFFNAGAQGIRVLWSALRAGGKWNKRGVTMLGGLVVLGLVTDFMNAMFSADGDDDGESDWDALDDFTKSRNIPIMPLKFKIPMAYGLNAFTNLGMQIGAYARGRKTADQALGNIAGVMFDSWNPMGGVDSLQNFIAPTLIDPVIDIKADNRDYADRPIVPEVYPGQEWTPDSERSWQSTPAYLKWISRMMNEWTGGDSQTPGAVDISPETLDYMIGQIFSGVGRFTMQTVNLPEKLIKGEATVNDVPFLRSFIQGEPSYLMVNKTYERLQEVDDTISRYKDKLEKESDKNAEEYEKKFRPLMDLETDAKVARKALRAVRADLAELDAKPGPMFRKARERKKLQDEQKSVIQEFNSAYNAALDKMRGQELNRRRIANEARQRIWGKSMK